LANFRICRRKSLSDRKNGFSIPQNCFLDENYLKIRPKSPKKCQTQAVIDSGADHCVFPAAYGRQLGIDIASGVHMPAVGLGGGDNWYFHRIKCWVEIEVQSWHWECSAAFSSNMDNLGIGLLGRMGFFELFEEVFFDQNNKIVKLKAHGDRPPHPPLQPPPN